MSLSAPRISIIGLGCSCQTAYQLSLHCAALGDALGIQGLKVESDYFDFIISPVPALVTFLDSFPELMSIEELSVVNRIPCWTKYSMMLNHSFDMHFIEHARELGGTFFEFGRSKMAHLRSKFLNLEERSREFLFVISNCQYDLERFLDARDRLFDVERIGSIHDLLRKRFGNRLRGLLVIEDDRSASGAWEIDGVARGNVGPSFSESWMGDSARWGAELLACLAKVKGWGAEAKR